MASQIQPEHPESRCWTCERPSDPDSVLLATLECSLPARDAHGYQVTVHKRGATVIVPVPRCHACRLWFGWKQAVVILSIFAGIFTPGLILVAYARLTGTVLPSDSLNDAANYPYLLALFASIGLSLAACWYAGHATLSWALGHRPIKSRNEKNFPPIAALLTAGWRWPSSSD